MARSDDDSYSSSSDRKRRRSSSKKSSKKHNKKKHKKKRKDRHDEDSDDEEDNRHSRHEKKKSRHDDEARRYSSSSDSEDRSKQRRRKKDHREEKRHYREKKKKKRKEKKRQRSRDRDDEEEGGSHNIDISPIEQRHFALADALLHLFTYHPPMASELPIMLIRLAGGTTFDLQQMTDTSAAVGLSQVFAALKPFGVEQQENGNNSSSTWRWKPPAGGGRSNRDELVLVRVVRAVMDQVGITTEAIDTYETNLKRPPPPPAAAATQPAAAKQEANTTTTNLDTSKIELAAQDILKLFGGGDDGDNDNDERENKNDSNNQNNKLSQELAGLCTMILDGESIALDGLPDEKLRSRLEQLFEECGLEKSEMEEDDGDDSSDEEEEEDDAPTMGYALPDENDGTARSMIAAVVNICRGGKVVLTTNLQPRHPAVKGPVMDGQDASAWNKNNNDDDDSDDDDDEGPAPYGAQKGPALPPEMVKARAQARARQLERVKSGMDPSTAELVEGNAREEWMLVPGKFDFLGEIKSGKTIRSRTFEAKSKGGGKDGEGEGPIDATVQAEVDAIKRAHEESRGPSLMEVHRQKKKQKSAEAQAAAAEAAAAGGGKSSSWKWNRDKDLDSGRRVDKDALKMVLGGASSDLKSKFQGGYG